MKLRFKDWKIRTKILMSLIALTFFFLYVIIRSYSAMVDFTGNKIPLVLANEAINTELLEMRNSEKDFLLLKTSEVQHFKESKIDYIDQFEKNYNDLITNLNSVKNNQDIQDNEELRSKLTDILNTVSEYHDNFLNVAENINKIGFEDYDKYQAAIAKLTPMLTEFHNLILENINSEVETIIKIVIITTVVIILIVLLFSLYVSKVITKPINQTNDMLRDIAEGDGDLTKQLSINTKEELGTLASWFNQFIYKIKNTVGIVQKNADIIAASSIQLTSASDQANQEIDNIANEINRITDGLQNNAGL